MRRKLQYRIVCQSTDRVCAETACGRLTLNMLKKAMAELTNVPHAYHQSLTEWQISRLKSRFDGFLPVSACIHHLNISIILIVSIMQIRLAIWLPLRLLSCYTISFKFNLYLKMLTLCGRVPYDRLMMSFGL
jgi:hypothetical protein